VGVGVGVFVLLAIIGNGYQQFSIKLPAIIFFLRKRKLKSENNEQNVEMGLAPATITPKSSHGLVHSHNKLFIICSSNFAQYQSGEKNG
jgi:hypothetical protein